MEEETNDTVVEEEIGEETPETDLTPETDWEAEAKKARGIAQRALTKLKKLGEKPKDKVESTPEPVEKTQTTGELDEMALDYLDVKGITEDEDIKVIEAVAKKTGQTVRQVLKDDYVKAKLKANQEARDVKNATPSSTKRTGAGASDTFEIALAKYEQSGVLPDDFELRSKVINFKIEKENTNKPAWH